MNQSKTSLKDWLELTIQSGEISFERNDFENYKKNVLSISKLIGKLCDIGQIDLALEIQVTWYNRLVKKIETEENHFRAFSLHTGKMFDLGHRYRRLPSKEPLEKTLCFITHTGTLLAHTETMLKVVQDWKELNIESKIFLFSLNGMSKTFLEKLQGLSIHCEVANSNLSPSEKLLWLRKRCDTHRIATAIWLSTSCWVAFAFGLGIARKQVMWSLKFHSVHMGSEIKHIGLEGKAFRTEVYFGGYWEAFTPRFSEQRIINDSTIISREKTVFGGRFIFGTIAREELINSIEFADLVADILKHCRDAIYLYTGRKSPKVFENHIEKLGLRERIFFIGWVDTKLYAEVLDVFLEPFPFGCGLTIAQALNVGTNCISIWSRNTFPKIYSESLTEARTKSETWKVVDSRIEYLNEAINLYKTKPTKKPYNLYDLDKKNSIDLARILELKNKCSTN